MKCETPARASGSSREPAPIQNPSATERTPGTRSEMTRSPSSSSVRRCFDTPRDGMPDGPEPLVVAASGSAASGERLDGAAEQGPRRRLDAVQRSSVA